MPESAETPTVLPTVPAGPAPGAEVAVRPPTYTQPMTPQDRWMYAQTIAPARGLPGVLRNSPADVYLRIEYGVAVGIPPVSAINTVHIIDGKPSASAGLISALVRGKGHRLRVWTEPDPDYPGEVRAVCTIVRADDPEFTYRVVWDIARALAARLVKIENGRVVGMKGPDANWSTYRPAMLKARAISEAGREACEDVLMGVGYTPEELGANVDGHGDLIGEVIDERPARQAAPAAPAEGEDTGQGGPTPQNGPQRVDPDRLRGMILEASTPAELEEALVEAGYGEVTGRGSVILDGPALKLIRTANAGGLVLTAWELIAEHGKLLRERAAVDPGDADPEADTDAAPTPSGGRFDRGSRAGDHDPWATDPGMSTRPAGVEDIHDAELVEPEAGAEHRAPVDGHNAVDAVKATLRARREAAQRASSTPT